MLIVADENIPFAREAFESLGEVRLAAGRRMNARTVCDAELLLVRSVTPVNRELLEGSRVRFVATATIGADHVDEAYLRAKGVGFAAAPGSNANSVGEYIMAALLELARRGGFSPAGKTLGVVGAGNVGARVAAKAIALGLTPVLNDPPLARRTGDPKYRPIEELFGCDFISFHVPLEKSGPDATWHMAGAEFLRRCRRGVIVLNSSRGAVADGAALLAALESNHVGAAVLDVWEGEPAISAALLHRVALGTPHIAGYSLDGKVNGTEMIYRAACRFLSVAPRWTPAAAMPAPLTPELIVPEDSRPAHERLHEAVSRIYSIARDDEALRGMLRLPQDEQGRYFDRLRKEYPVRREFHNTLARASDPALRAALDGLGFRLA